MEGKKGQMGKTIGIIAVFLVLAIVVILVLQFFWRGAESGEKSFFGCASNGGKCLSSTECSDQGGTVNDNFE